MDVVRQKLDLTRRAPAGAGCLRPFVLSFNRSRIRPPIGVSRRAHLASAGHWESTMAEGS